MYFESCKWNNRIWHSLVLYSFSLVIPVLVNVKVKWSRYRPGVAQRVGRGIALLFHDRGTGIWWVVSSTPRPHFTLGKDPVPIVQEAVWAPGPVWTDGKSRPHRDSIPNHPAPNQSLYGQQQTLVNKLLKVKMLQLFYGLKCHAFFSVLGLFQRTYLFRIEGSMNTWRRYFVPKLRESATNPGDLHSQRQHFRKPQNILVIRKILCVALLKFVSEFKHIFVPLFSFTMNQN